MDSRRSEYGAELEGALERLSNLDYEDHSDDNETVAALKRSINDKMPNDPVDKYVTEVKDNVIPNQTALAIDTNIENMVSVVTKRCLDQFASNDIQDEQDKYMVKFME